MPAPPYFSLPPGAKCLELGVGLADIFTSPARTDRVTARHICRVHCPVLQECRAMVVAAEAANEAGEPAFHSCVVGGMDLTGQGVESKIYRARPSCFICRPTPVLLSPGVRRTMVHGSEATARAHVEAGEPLCSDCENGRAYRERKEAQRLRSRNLYNPDIHQKEDAS